MHKKLKYKIVMTMSPVAFIIREALKKVILSPFWRKGGGQRVEVFNLRFLKFNFN